MSAKAVETANPPSRYAWKMATKRTTGSGFPDQTATAALLGRIETRSSRSREIGPWRSGVFTDLANSGCLGGWIDSADGGSRVSEQVITEFLVSLATRCLTTALALTQWASAVRIISRANAATRQRFLPDLATGKQFTTVGISHLTTSRRHLTQPAMVATNTDSGWKLDGLCPWVTGADSVNLLVTGAVATHKVGGEPEPRFFVVQTDSPGVTVEPPMKMLALTGSRTSCVRLTGVEATAEIIPSTTSGSQTGGLGTTALALGSTLASLNLLAREASHRESLLSVANGLREEADAITSELLAATRDGIDTAERNALRQRANTLVTRAAQAALSASKGAGFLAGHPAERLLREAMFFLVWSCPQPVTDSWLCDLAGLGTSIPDTIKHS